ncbi:dicarboxylate/amino acid:cation symporter [Bordetella hinzii]|uniref:dicarboxylate/amino acid:cation symporter n=1 Tax=Bordetella hinzii TaxID=103855 RepID=UPI0039FDDD32|nr:dicarboxylate/amino acid:cation symporter [Bordetella hinzii]
MNSRFIKSVQAFSLRPSVMIFCLLAGSAVGTAFPVFGKHLAVVGDVYVDLLKMTTLPFMISAVIFSLQRLFRVGSTPLLFLRLLLLFVVALAMVSALGTVVTVLARPGSELPSAVLHSLGSYVDGGASSDTHVMMYGPDVEASGPSLSSLLSDLIPTNIFAALAAGDSLKALIFALLFGVAVGCVPERTAAGLSMVLETVYHACQKIIQALSLPLPIILFCMSAAQIAASGLEPMLAMLRFLAVFGLVSVLLLVLAVIIIWRRSGVDLAGTLRALRDPFSMALATRNSAAAMPAMIEGLSERLGYSRLMVELLVPLTISLLRLGPTAYYVCATLFIAQLYGTALSLGDLAVVITASILAGLASAGSTGILTVSLIGIACSYLGLPFEAAFLLFLAIDPVCDILRTQLLVIGNTAVVAAICPRPLRI